MGISLRVWHRGLLSKCGRFARFARLQTSEDAMKLLRSAALTAAIIATPYAPLLAQSRSTPGHPGGARNDWHAGVLDLSHSLNARLHPVPVQAVHLGDGFWTERRRVTTERSLPTMLALLEEHGTVDNFRRLSEHKNVPRRGPVYTDSDLYKWMEAASWALASNETSDASKARIGEQLRSLISVISGAQEPIGYRNTYYVGAWERLRFTELTGSHDRC